MKNELKLSLTEEDYLKAIFYLSEHNEEGISTNEIAKKIDISAASVSDMIRKLANKTLVDYVKYQGVRLTESGRRQAIYLIRKHRLWETFLVQKLNFAWDEVHEIAEQLEHIHSQTLIDRLDTFLGFPEYDPHGDPIPNSNGKMAFRNKTSLKNAPVNTELKVVAVTENSPLFLKHLNKLNIHIDTLIKIADRNEYDESIEVEVDQNQRKLMFSKEVAENVFVIPIK